MGWTAMEYEVKSFPYHCDIHTNSGAHPASYSHGVRQPWWEANNSPPTSVEVNSTWICIFIPPYVLVKHRNKFAFFYALQE
jgi:hypothetical protein